MNKEKMITLKEAAEMSGYAPDYIGQLIRKGKIPGKQVYMNVAWMTTKEAVEEYMKTGESVRQQRSKFSFVRDLLSNTRHVSLLFKVLTYLAVSFLSVFLVLLFYILSVTIDHKINQQYLEKAEHAQR